MFSFLKNMFSANTEIKPVEVNFATGLPLIEDSQIDVGGNFFGFSNDSFSANDTFILSSFSSFD